MKPLKGLHIVTSLRVGGVETYVIRLLRCFNRERFTMHVCYELAEPGAYAEEARSLGCRLFRVGGKLWFLPYLRALSRLLRYQGYDAICDYSGDFSGVSMLAGRLVGVKRRLAFYQSAGIAHKRDPFRMLYRRFARSLVRQYSTCVLSNSVSNFEAFFPNRKQRTSKFHVVPNGLDLEEFRLTDAQMRAEAKKKLNLSSRFVVGHVGGFRSPKNHKLIVSVFDSLRNKIPNASLLLVGDGSLRPNIEADVRRRGLQSSVILAGVQSPVTPYLAAMDVFLFPSLYEGMPNAMTEAQASGLPVLASNVPSVFEHIPTSGRRFTVPLETEDRWVELLVDLASDADERAAQGRANRAHIELNYALERRVDEFLTLLSGEGAKA